MRILVCFFSLLLSSCVVTEQKVDNDCDAKSEPLSYTCIHQIGLKERFDVLHGYIDRVLSDFHIKKNVSFKVMSERNEYGDDAWIEWIENGYEKYIITIFTTADMLRNESLMNLEHVAEHEVCHVKMKHYNVNLSVINDVYVEKEAEFCVLKHVGEKKYFDYMISLASKYPELQTLSKEELIKRIRDIQRDIEKDAHK